MIRIGYAGVNTELPTASRTFRLAGYSDERMLEVAHANILALEEILCWNERQGIRLFRITSNLIPFGSHPVNSGSWKQVLSKDFERIGLFIRRNGMRVSMHPGQHTVLNTPDEGYFASVLRDLEYHHAVLNLMGLDEGHVVVAHGGGGYGNTVESLGRLRRRIDALPLGLRKHLALENDDHVFTASDIHTLCRETGLPGILDVFHHEVLPSWAGMNIREIILLFRDTWKASRQKIHYSNQDPDKRKGSHSGSIEIPAFGSFLENVADLELDIMLETKDKQASVLALRKAFPCLK
jgi:UV DNA damage endonuclease